MLNDVADVGQRAPRRRLAQGEARRAFEPNDEPSAAIHRVNGVDEEVHKQLLEVMALSTHIERLVGQLEVDRNIGKDALRSEQIDRRSHDIIDVDRLGCRRPSASIVEQPADNALDARALALERG